MSNVVSFYKVNYGWNYSVTPNKNGFKIERYFTNGHLNSNYSFITVQAAPTSYEQCEQIFSDHHK
jgi:hypothetical protein